MTAHSDILAAQDLPGLDPSIYDALATQMGIGNNQIKGIPLVTKTKMIATAVGLGTVRVTQAATDISTDTIPESKFEVPEGYTETTQSAIFSTPGAAMPGT